MFFISDVLDSYFSFRLKSKTYRRKIFLLALGKKLRNSKTGLVLLRNLNKVMTRHPACHDEFRYLLNGQNYQKCFWESDLGYAWYFWNPPSENPYFKMVLEEMKSHKLTSLLDIGCGWGGLSAMAAELPCAEKVVGIDISEEIILAADKLFPNSKAKFIFQDVKQMHEKFDLAVIIGSTDYISPLELHAILRHLLTIVTKEIMIVNSLRKIDFGDYLQLRQAKEILRYDMGYAHPMKALLTEMQSTNKFTFEISRVGEDSALSKIILA
jgi:SAM-dependent methyltransferase